MRKLTLALLTALLIAGGVLWIWTTTAPEALVIDQARIRLVPNAGPQAGYFILHNRTSGAVTLQAASSPVFGRVMMHQSRVQNGQSRMQPLDDGVLVAPGESIEFAPGGMHLMLLQAQQDLKVGDTVPVILEFAGHDQQTQSFTHHFIVVPLTP